MQFYASDTLCKVENAVHSRFSLGRMFVKNRPNPRAGEMWALDNGAFSCFRQGKPFNAGLFRKRLAATYDTPPQFVMLPDVVGDRETTLKWANQWLDGHEGEWPWYLVIQDGMAGEDLAPFWGRIRGLFLGGTDRLKADAQYWCDLAHSKGKKFHYGRASTPRKLAHAIRCYSDSADTARINMMTPKEYSHMLYLIHNPEAAFYTGDLLSGDNKVAEVPNV